jgi:hypothetical protein
VKCHAKPLWVFPEQASLNSRDTVQIDLPKDSDSCMDDTGSTAVPSLLKMTAASKIPNHQTTKNGGGED